MQQVTEWLLLTIAICLAALAVVLTGNPSEQRWAADYIAAAFAPTAADLGPYEIAVATGK